MKSRYAPLYGVLLLLLTACATLNVPAPATWNQRVLAAYHTVDAATQSTQTLVIAGKVAKADAQKIHDRLVDARNAIDLADQAHGTNPAAGEDQLALAIRALQAIQTELQKRQTP